jgi:hypothetical protein
MLELAGTSVEVRKLIQMITFLAYIPEVAGSNLCRVTDYPD